MGYVRVALYIPSEVAGFSVGGKKVGWLTSSGDDRGPDPFAHDTRSRAVFTVDYLMGMATFEINPSCGTGGPPVDCHSALPIIDNFSRGSTWAQKLPFVDDSNRVVIIEDGDDITTRFSIINSDKRFAANFSEVNGEFTVSVVSDRVCINYHRDSFPAMEAYHYRDHIPEVLVQEDQAWGPTAGLTGMKKFQGSNCFTGGSGAGGGGGRSR